MEPQARSRTRRPVLIIAAIIAVALQIAGALLLRGGNKPPVQPAAAPTQATASNPTAPAEAKGDLANGEFYSLIKQAKNDDQQAIVSAIEARCKDQYAKAFADKPQVTPDSVRVATGINNLFDSQLFMMEGGFARLSAGCHSNALTIDEQAGFGAVYYLSRQADKTWRIDHAGQMHTEVEHRLLKDRGYPDSMNPAVPQP